MQKTELFLKKAERESKYWRRQSVSKELSSSDAKKRATTLRTVARLKEKSR